MTEFGRVTQVIKAFSKESAVSMHYPKGAGPQRQQKFVGPLPTSKLTVWRATTKFGDVGVFIGVSHIPSPAQPGSQRPQICWDPYLRQNSLRWSYEVWCVITLTNNTCGAGEWRVSWGSAALPIARADADPSAPKIFGTLYMHAHSKSTTKFCMVITTRYIYIPVVSVDDILARYDL